MVIIKLPSEHLGIYVCTINALSYTEQIVRRSCCKDNLCSNTLYMNSYRACLGLVYCSADICLSKSDSIYCLTFIVNIYGIAHYISGCIASERYDSLLKGGKCIFVCSWGPVQYCYNLVWIFTLIILDYENNVLYIRDIVHIRCAS